ncbi:MAG: glycerol acyltransferase [Frankiales bacterium]|nr:glycerol acyltransferase [Frankiales bacterium]
MADLVYWPVIGVARTLFAALGLDFRITGAENVPRTGGAIMALNHVGYLDFTFGGLAAQPAGRLVRFMAKKEVFDHPVSGPLMRGMRHIPVDRTGAAADSFVAAVEAARRGELVGVFPEATISESFELKEFKTGAVRMAREAGVPLLPTVLWGSQRVWTKGRSKDLTRGTPIRIVIGEPYVPDPALDAGAATADLKARMQLLLEEARDTYPGGPRTPDDTWWLPAASGGTAPTLEEAEARSREELAAKAARRAAREAGQDS